MLSPETWAFDYRKSRFTWSELYVDTDVPYRNPGTVAAELVNGTGGEIDFIITEKPSWILSAIDSAGDVAAER